MRAWLLALDGRCTGKAGGSQGNGGCGNQGIKH